MNRRMLDNRYKNFKGRALTAFPVLILACLGVALAFYLNVPGWYWRG